MSMKFIIGLVVLYFAGVIISAWVEMATVTNTQLTIVGQLASGNFGSFFDALTFNFSFFRGDLAIIRWLWLGTYGVITGYGIWAAFRGIPV